MQEKPITNDWHQEFAGSSMELLINGMMKLGVVGRT
jgi:hypothetical protein